MTEITQIISTVGFPIFSFLLCGYALKFVYVKERASLDSAIDKIASLTDAVNHNSETVNRLVNKLDKEEENDSTGISK